MEFMIVITHFILMLLFRNTKMRKIYKMIYLLDSNNTEDYLSVF